MVITEIVSQHAEEASFLWLLRTNAVRAPHYALKDLVKLDDRVEAHLDGLRVAGEAGWELCKAALGNEEPGEVFAASVMACESGIESRMQAVFDAVEKAPELTKGLVSALGWIPLQQVAPHIQRLLTAESPLQKRIGLAARAVHRQDPGASLKEALPSTDPVLKARGLKAVGELGRKDYLPLVATNLGEEDLSCRFWAGWSGALLGEPAAISLLRSLAVPEHAKGLQACAMALRRMPHADAHAWIKVLANEPRSRRLAVIGAGALGDPGQIPWLIEQMAVPEMARVAGEAFTMITGVDLAYDDLDTNKPEGFEAGPTENSEDDNVEMDPDEDLPWPNPELIQKWWHAHRLEFQNGTRYLLGKPMTIEWLKQVLKTGRQRQRTAAAIELAILQPGTPLFNTHAPGFRQQQLLGSKSS